MIRLHAAGTLDHKLAEHGLTADQLQGLARRAMTDELNRRKAWLDPAAYEDLHSELVEIAIGLANDHDPTKGTLSYSTRAYRIMRLRTISYLRRRIRESQRMSDEDTQHDSSPGRDPDFTDLVADQDRIARWAHAADTLGFDVTSWILASLDEAAERATKDAA